MAELEDLQLDLALSTNKKRGFDEAFPHTLPLFVWDDNRSDIGDVIGWPPVKSSRIKKLGRDNCECTAANYIGGGRSYYVKAEMEGIGIARKLDLNIHHSYQSLTATLLPMFGKSCDENVVMYKLTYQDKEGDWLLAGDVPWGDFVQSVRRLKLVKEE